MPECGNSWQQCDLCCSLFSTSAHGWIFLAVSRRRAIPGRSLFFPDGACSSTRVDLMAAPDRWKFQVCRDAGYSGHLQVGTDTLRVSASPFLTFKLLHRGHMLLARFSPQLR